MKIFDSKNSPWDEKVNFVDENNVCVGYDMRDLCCEYAGWFISDNRENEICEFPVPDLEDFRFDTDFFEDVTDAKGLDDGGMVRFRLVSLDGSEKFLHLFNSHNGYYSHGFRVSVGGVCIRSGSL